MKDEITEFYEEEENYVHEFLPHVKESHLYSLFIQENLQYLTDKIILMVGCNVGNTLPIIYRNIREGKLYGIDINKKAIEKAKINISEFKDIILKHESAHKTSFESKFFDTIILWDVYEHWRPKDLALFNKEIVRILKDEGNILLYVPRAEKNNKMAFDTHHKGFYSTNEELLATFLPFFKGEATYENRANPGNTKEKHCGIFAKLRKK